jgi:hypothetical protein
MGPAIVGERFSSRAIELMLSLPTERRNRTLAIVSVINTPDSPAQRPDDRMTLGGNFWTLFTQGNWKDLHAVLQLSNSAQYFPPNSAQNFPIYAV